MPAPDAIIALCQTFAAHRDHYRSAAYNETELRREFLDPFFKALGWDIDNEQGYADAYKDVVHEDAIKIGGITKAPDYCFRIGGTRKYFMEAKKPSVNLHKDVAPAYQLRRYAWSAKLPLSILSDFEEFAIYDCRAKPSPSDKPSASRTFYCTFEDYPEKWDEIAAIFSREAVLKGSFDKYALATKSKRGTTEVDAAFLTEIERWRETLARNLALRNQALGQRDLNESVQKIIDRLIFLRICEDRGTEDYERLRKRLSGKDLYPILLEEFRRADDRYNSGLFHFSAEKGRPDAPDTLTPGLALDDKVLKDIIKNLYYPDSPYEFSVFSADILGQVYEQFLGKTIHLTAGHQARIEEKPEVRKAGGVYYTPKTIVDCIVAHTLGRLLNGDTSGGKPASPITIDQAAHIKLLDPACGSGSFLIIAYQLLLDWHRDQYTLDPQTGKPDPKKAVAHAKGKKPVIYQAAGGEYKLTIAERKRILLNNIYGVDIDSQAVEVTKLSLLLKVLEGETSKTAERDLFQERQRILPDLGSNIQCGNSLIGPDFYDQENLSDLDDEAKYRINVFDWQTAFPQVFKQAGFDCVIGNPPYGAAFSAWEQDYLRKRFRLAEYQLDSYLIFLEASLELCKPEGRVGEIIPNTWLLNHLSAGVRRHLIAEKTLHQIIDFRKPVFKDATVATQIVIASNPPPCEDALIAVSIKGLKGSDKTIEYNVRQREWIALNGATLNIMNFGAVAEITKKVAQQPILEVSWKITQGCKPFQVGKGKPAQTRQTLNDKPFVQTSQVDASFRPLLRGSLMHKYDTRWRNDYFISFGDWLAEPRYSAQYDAPEKIVIRQTGDSLIATMDRAQFVVRDNLYTILPTNPAGPSLAYLLGLINSKLLNHYYQFALNPEMGEALAQVKRAHLAKLPIRPIDFTSKTDVALHDKMVALVESMLSLHKKQTTEQNTNILKQIATEIAATDRRIDKLVYQLYGLNEGEIALVEA